MTSTCRCGQPNRPRQRNCAECHRAAQRRFHAKRKAEAQQPGAAPRPKRKWRQRQRLLAANPLALVDAAFAAGRCMWRVLASKPCMRKATVRDGPWLACDEHARPRK